MLYYGVGLYCFYHIKLTNKAFLIFCSSIINDTIFVDYDVIVNVATDTTLEGAYGRTLLRSITTNGGLSIGNATKAIKSTPLLLISDTSGLVVNEGTYVKFIFVRNSYIHTIRDGCKLKTVRRAFKSPKDSSTYRSTI